MLESREFRRKIKAKSSQGAHFGTFFLKIRCIYRKMINAYRIFNVKRSASSNFMCLQSKELLEICQKELSLNLITALIMPIWALELEIS